MSIEFAIVSGSVIAIIFFLVKFYNELTKERILVQEHN
jgi:hypothetical protein